MSYAINKQRAIYRDTTPTLTDQAGADASNINIIVGQQLITGYAPGAPKPPLFGDFSNFPRDLRETLELSQAAKSIRNQLPVELRNVPIEDLLQLTTDDLTRILTPPKPKEPNAPPPQPQP